MNPSRILGQVLLWAGFISAALAASSQLEFDFLSDAEKSAIEKLPEEFELPKTEVENLAGKSMDELTNEEFISLVDAALPVYEQQKRESETNITIDIDLEDESEYTDESEPPKTVAKNDLIKSRVTMIENKWPTIPWLWYGLSIAIGVIGVVLLRATAKSAQQETGRVAEEYSTLTDCLGKLNDQIANLSKSLDKMSPREIVHFIDDNCGENFAGFADARNALIQRFGMQPYAEIMTQFASGERFINRAWSAAADGYVNEVRTCVDRALAHLVEASRLLKQYESENRTA